MSDSCDPMDYSPPGSSVHGLFQARILACVAMSSSRGSSCPRDQTCISYIVGRFFTTELPEKSKSRWLLVPKYWVRQSTLTQPQPSNPTIIAQPLANPIYRSCLLDRMVQPSNWHFPRILHLLKSLLWNTICTEMLDQERCRFKVRSLL